MAICCESTENLGCYGHCDTIDTEVMLGAGTTQVYTIMTQEGYYKEITFNPNTKITFTNFFNEDKITVFYITNAAGTRILSANGKDCFMVTTTVQIEV